MDRRYSVPPRATRLFGFLPPVDAAEDAKKNKKQRRAGMDSVAPHAALVCPTGLLLPPVDAAEDGNKIKKQRRAGMYSPAALICPTATGLDAAEDGSGTKTGGNLAVKKRLYSSPTGILPPVNAAEDGVFVNKGAAQAARALPPPLGATTQAEASKKMVAAEGGAKSAGIVGKIKKLQEDLLGQALRTLPPPPDSRIRADGGEYDPYAMDLFLYRRASPPWDAVWKSHPLVLHDRRLVEKFGPWYLAGEPRDQVEAVTRVLGHHPGPVSSFRLHSSLCPDTEILGCWMDALSDKGVSELVVFDLYGDVTATMFPTRFPLQRLKTDSLTILALGFFRIAGEELCNWCDGVSFLVALSLTGCSFTASALSMAITKLGCLRTLIVLSCNLSLAVGGLIIDSMSLQLLRLWKCAGTKLVIEYAPLLGYLEIGISHLSGQQVPIVVREAAALQELHGVALRLHTMEIHGAKGPAFKWKKRESLHYLTTLSIALDICLPEQGALFAELLSLFPALTQLTVSRVDDLPASGNDNLSVAQSWYISPMPKCLKSSLQKLVISDYRGGTAELALLKSLLEAVPSLVSISVHPHDSNVFVSPEKKEAIENRIQALLPRASKKCRISVVTADSSS